MERCQIFGMKLFTLLNQSNRFFPYFSILFSLLLIPYNSYLIHKTHQQHLNPDDRRNKILDASKAITLSILSIIASVCLLIFAAPYLLIVSTSKNFVDNLLALTLSIYRRISFSNAAEKESIRLLRQLISKQIKQGLLPSAESLKTIKDFVVKENTLKKQMWHDAHKCLIGLVALLASIFNLTPLAPVGIVLMAGLACYSTLDQLHLNPFVLAAKAIHYVLQLFFHDKNMLPQQAVHQPSPVLHLLNAKNLSTCAKLFAALKGDLTPLKHPLKIADNIPETSLKNGYSPQHEIDLPVGIARIEGSIGAIAMRC